ncbi:MAG: kynureninase [Solirubrobacterales bacterium]|nr:kynureninase [Solirubrobacterales bacterium]
MADAVRGLTREDALALDAADPLAAYRERFVIADPELLYVDGNSLGRRPLATADALQALATTWGEELVGGWESWIAWPATIGDELAPLIGAGPGETLVCDSVTVNLFKLAGAVLATRPGVVVCSPDEFPTDRYVLDALGREVVASAPEAEALRAACAGREVALVVFSAVDYRSGALADMAAVGAAAHELGALVLWDLSHAVGSVEVDLRGTDADLAVGCTYKYLNGGPGAPAFLWVRGGLIDGLTSPIPGWFGAADQFDMGPSYAPAPGVARFLAGTPPMVALAAIRPGVAMLAEAGMPAVAAKGRALTGLAIALHDQWLAPAGFTLGTPRDPWARGAHVALRHPDAWRITRALIERARVVPDFRKPDVVRLGLPALTTSFADVFDACERLRDLVAAGEHERVDPAPRRVT